MSVERRFELNEVWELLGEESLLSKYVPRGGKESIEVEGFKVYRKSLRYCTFYQKGTKCVCCGREGTHFRLDADRDGGNIDGRRHFNLYSDGGVLMTKDHILPKHWGGQDNIDNMQTMCSLCNEAKGSQYDATIMGIRAVMKSNPEKVYTFMNENDATFWLCERTKALQNNKAGKIARKAIDIAFGLMGVLDTDIPYYGFYWRKEPILVQGKPYGGGQTNE